MYGSSPQTTIPPRSELSDAVLKDGSVALTADWDAGPHKITAEQLESDIATGTAPIIVASTTVVANLNADLLDGQEGAYYRDADNLNAGLVTHERGGLEFDASAITTGGLIRGSAAGTMSILTVGSDGQVLTAQADGSVAWEDAVGAAVDAITLKSPVKAATTANITLSGEQTIDGVSCTAGDRVLVKDQSTASQNGIYVVVASGSWTRATDYAAGDAAAATFGHIEQGTINADRKWLCTNNTGSDTINTHNLAYSLSTSPASGSELDFVVSFDELFTFDSSKELPLSAGADDLGHYVAASSGIGSNANVIATTDFKAATISQKARFYLVLPGGYGGEGITIRLRANMLGSVADTSCTIDVEVYSQDGDGGLSSDLCTTAAQSMNSLTNTDKDFSVTVSSLSALQVLEVVVTIDGEDSATGTLVAGQITKITILFT